MAALEFKQIVTEAGKLTATMSGPPTSVRTKSLYTVPVDHVARVTHAQNLGASLIYSVTSATGALSGTDASAAGAAGPSRIRDISGSWLAEGDQVIVHDSFDLLNESSATQHPQGYFLSVEEYEVV